MFFFTLDSRDVAADHGTVLRKGIVMARWNVVTIHMWLGYDLQAQLGPRIYRYGIIYKCSRDNRKQASA